MNYSCNNEMNKRQRMNIPTYIVPTLEQSHEVKTYKFACTTDMKPIMSLQELNGLRFIIPASDENYIDTPSMKAIQEMESDMYDFIYETEPDCFCYETFIVYYEAQKLNYLATHGLKNIILQTIFMKILATV